MPGQLTALTTQIQDWANRQDWPPTLVQSFIKMCEQKLNAELRVSRMLNSAANTITCRCSTLPDDWLEMFLVRIANENGADGFLPIRYKSNDEFFNLTDDWSYGYYTIVGRVINFGGAPDATEGVAYTINYFSELPPLNDQTDSWLLTKYPSLYLYGSLLHSDLYAVGEEQKAANMKQLVEDTITKLNNEYLMSKSSGSRVTRSKVRSFG
jgi:hypothetical protein